MNVIIKLILTVIVIFLTTFTYTIAVELSGHGLISSMVNGIGGMMIVYIWWIKKPKSLNNDIAIKQNLENPKSNFNSTFSFVRNNAMIILILLVVSFLFYWFQIRPAKIRSYCNWSIRYGEDYREGLNLQNFELRYKSCMRSKGLER